MRTDGVKLLMLSLLLSVLAVGCGKPSNESAQTKTEDPVAALRALLARIEKNGTNERVVSQNGERWQKRKFRPADLRYDVKKTDSLVSPIVAVVTWIPVEYHSDFFSTKTAADNAPLPEKPSKTWDFAGPWVATLAFRDGGWLLEDIRWGEHNTVGAPLQTHDLVRNYPENPIHDWWYAFGGE